MLTTEVNELKSRDVTKVQMMRWKLDQQLIETLVETIECVKQVDGMQIVKYSAE